MQSRLTRGLVLVLGLALTGAACGKYSIGNLRALKAFQDANVKYQKGEFKAAVDDYERVVKYNPDLGLAYFFLGNSYDNLYKAAKKGEPENDAYLPKAVENYKKAIDKLAGQTENRAPVIRNLSFQYLIAAYGTDKLNDLDQALPVAQQLIATEPNEPLNYQALGRLYEDAGRYEEAEAQFKKAIEVKPNDALAYATLAGYYHRQGDFEKTMEAWASRAAMEPKNPEAWHTIGASYQDEVFTNKKIPPAKAKEYVVAGIAAEDKALGINPEYYEALIFKNILLRLQANVEKDPAVQKRLLSEADDLKRHADEVQKKQTAAAAATAGTQKKGAGK
jgi:tetratricopeptide (TPR) repeat protein